MSYAGIRFRITVAPGDKKRDEGLMSPADITRYDDISYANCGKSSLLDVYLPESGGLPLPVIVNVHGGAYVYGTKEVYQFYGMSLAQRGFAFVNPNYRLAPRHRFPAPLEDMNAVLCWIKANAAKYGFDTDNVFMVGDSAGAQILSQYAAIYSNPAYAALFPFTPPDVSLRAVGLMSGMYDPVSMTQGSMRGIRRDYFTGRPQKFGGMLDVLGSITEEYPPSFVMTASCDSMRADAEPMAKLLKERGLETVFKCYGEEGDARAHHDCHVDVRNPIAKLVNDDMAEYFKEHMV